MVGPGEVDDDLEDEVHINLNQGLCFVPSQSCLIIAMYTSCHANHLLHVPLQSWKGTMLVWSI